MAGTYSTRRDVDINSSEYRCYICQGKPPTEGTPLHIKYTVTCEGNQLTFEAWIVEIINSQKETNIPLTCPLARQIKKVISDQLTREAHAIAQETLDDDGE